MHDETGYLREVERLARAVVLAPGDERALDELAKALRHQHFDGDGCLDEERDRPVARLAGVRLLKPGQDDYAAQCAAFDVEPRPEGWALWYSWGTHGEPATMVVTAVAGTEGLLRAWAAGLDFLPTEPWPGQVVQVRTGWPGSMTLAPRTRRRFGLAGY